MRGRRTLVTGATGFIGRHIVHRLLEDGAVVSALTRPAARWVNAWRDRVERIECSNWRETGIRKVLAQHPFEVILHLAAYGVNPSDRDVGQMVLINVDMPAALTRLCRERNAGLVMAGTFSEYDRPRTEIPVDEGAPLEHSRIYGASKAAGGLLANSLACHLGVELRILRLFKVYGPGEAPHRLLPTLVSDLSKRRRVALSNGTQVLDFIHVSDVVGAFMHACSDISSSTQASVKTWNVCTGIGHSVGSFAFLVADALDAPRSLLGFGDIPMRANDAPWVVGDNSRIKRDVGWQPACDLESGVRDSVAKLMAGVASYA